MTPRKRLQALFDGSRDGEPVVCLHAWGRYPFEFFGEEPLWDRGAQEPMAGVYEAFLDRFSCDWLHVCEAASRYPVPPPSAESAPLDESAIDAWIARNADGRTIPREEVLNRGNYAHVRVLADRLGGRIMIFPNQGAPGSGFPGWSWQEQVLFIEQYPDVVRRFVLGDCERFLERVRAAGDCGADGYIFSEGYAGVCDVISPATFRRVFLDIKRDFYEAVRQEGLYGIGYFLGGIEPYLEAINAIRPDGVMIEESKKGFRLDPARIREALDPGIALFGNVDSCLLLNGSRDAIRDEVRRQAEARRYGTFAFANGSPICPGTPAENLDAFLETARSVR